MIYIQHRVYSAVLYTQKVLCTKLEVYKRRDSNHMTVTTLPHRAEPPEDRLIGGGRYPGQ